MSTSNFYGSICLSDIPKELIKTGKNGKKYLSILVNERRTPSSFGHTHCIKAYVRREEQEQGKNYFIGDLKPSDINYQSNDVGNRNNINDLPF